MTTDILKKRYLANLVGLAISLVTQSIIHRSFGPKPYGDSNFLSNFFSQIRWRFNKSVCEGADQLKMCQKARSKKQHFPQGRELAFLRDQVGDYLGGTSQFE